MRRHVLTILIAMALPVSCAVAQEEKTAAADRQRIEITAPGEYTGSDCVYVMTKDVVAPGNGLSFTGKNIVIDLGGHTLTFDTKPYKPVFDEKMNAGQRYMFTPPYGICLQRGSGNVELKNGTIVQGAGHDKNTRGLFIRANKTDIHDLTVVISGGDMARNVFAMWAGSDIELHHNYFVNHAVAESNWYGAISLTEAGTPWDIHHNTIVGGHQGILVAGRREKEGVHVHHNYIQHKRTRGAKAPQGIYMRASGCEIDHNEIVTIDGRGLEPTGIDNYWHDNVVDVRYTSKAGGGFYPENRCYGYWARNPNGNRIEDNLFVVNNEVLGDESSNTIGILLCTDPGRAEPLRNCTVTGNRIIVHHNDKTRPAWALRLTNTGDEVIIKDNWIWADTAGVIYDGSVKGSRVEGNTFVKPDARWEMGIHFDKRGSEAEGRCIFKDNKVVNPPADKDAPAAPKGLKITKRINGFELHWSPNAEKDVLGYYVYRDGRRVEDRLKCGRFYVDTSADPTERYEYAISAVDLAGNEGPKGEVASTATVK